MRGDPKYPIWSGMRFLIWAFLGLMVAALFSSSSSMLQSLGLLINVAFLVMAPKWSSQGDKQFSNQVAFVVLFAVLAVFGVSVLVVTQHWMEYGFDGLYWLHHPAVVWPVWMSVIGVGYWRWKRAASGQCVSF